MEYLSKEDLILGQLYEVEGRNLGIGLWSEVKSGWRKYAFVYLRTKFNQKYIDTEYHWDEGTPFGTAKPIKKYEGEITWREAADHYLQS